MKTKRISHIGVLVHDADAAARLWTGAFGFQKLEDRRIEVEGIRSVFISVGGTWDEMVIEIMEPLDKSDMDNALSRRLARHGEGFYHLCIDPDFPAKILSGQLAKAPAVEQNLRIGPGILGPNSPIALLKTVNGFARVGWYYEQIYRLADGLEPDVSMSALRALIAYDKTEKTKARSLLP